MEEKEEGAALADESLQDNPQVKKNAELLFSTAFCIVKTPKEFFQTMPHTGGYGDPLLFLAVFGMLAGLIKSALIFFSSGLGAALFMALASIIIAPLSAILFGFIGAGIVFIVWKVMGSQEQFETAFRCIAYTAAIGPMVEIVTVLPYIGSLVGIAWGMYLIILASTEVHAIKKQTATVVFSLIGILLALNAVTTQYAARSVSRQVTKIQQEFSRMNAHEAGRAVGEFLRGFEEVTQPAQENDQQQDAQGA